MDHEEHIHIGHLGSSVDEHIVVDSVDGFYKIHIEYKQSRGWKDELSHPEFTDGLIRIEGHTGVVFYAETQDEETFIELLKIADTYTEENQLFDNTAK